MTGTPFEQRIAVISGASAGIGEAVARQLARAGARLVINARRADLLDTIAGEIGHDRVATVPGDSADPRVVESMLDTARDRFGRDADIVVVNAGRGLRGSVIDSDDGQWEEMIRTNVLGAARLMREGGKRMLELCPDPKDDEGGGGSGGDGGWLENPRDLVVLGSNVGRHISPFSSMYGATKFAVNSLAEALRRQLGPSGIRVSLIEPGIVRTEFQESAGYDAESFGQFMESVGPVLSADDVARTIMFVLSQPANVHVNDVLIRPTRQEYP